MSRTVGNNSTTNQISLLEITSFWGDPAAADTIEFMGAWEYDGGAYCHTMMTRNKSGGGYEVWRVLYSVLTP
jgi:hypothetical protein